jgi:cupin fold WbuC family metalloprotein
MRSYSVIDNALLCELAREARQAPRLRKNRNFHRGDDDPCHRFLNALEPGTYVQPHRHLDAGKDETIIGISGRIGVLIFSEDGQVETARILAPGSGTLGIHIPTGVYHSVVALESGAVFFESKAGPYMPVSDEERASWAPKEGELGSKKYLALLQAQFQPK